MVYKLILLALFLFGGYQLQDNLDFEKNKSAEQDEVVSAEVIRVIDGDTIEVTIDGKVEKVRYIGIDSPEPYSEEVPECFSKEASMANRNLVENKKVTLVPDLEDRDRYDRLLRYVYVGDVFVNKELVKDGFAEAINIKPNSTHYNEFLSLEEQARTEGKGMWGVCS